MYTGMLRAKGPTLTVYNIASTLAQDVKEPMAAWTLASWLTQTYMHCTQYQGTAGLIHMNA